MVHRRPSTKLCKAPKLRMALSTALQHSKPKAEDDYTSFDTMIKAKSSLVGLWRPASTLPAMYRLHESQILPRL